MLKKIGSQKNILVVFLCFLFLSSLGTVIHELGHYVPAKIFGLNPRLSFGSTFFEFKEGLTKNEKAIIFFCGPFFNMIIGSIAIVLLKLKVKANQKDIHLIILAAISFFWSRQVVIFLTDVIVSIFNKSVYSGNLSDEQRLSLQLDLPYQTLSILFGILGISACIYVVFGLLPKILRLPFIIFGLLGSLAGIYFWYTLIGPFLLP
jgi:uncharacterized membrane protein YphA (DoxX/SURF4 family)